MASVEISDRAHNWLVNAEPDVRERIRRKLTDMSEFPEHYLDRLSGSEYYKLRVGDYRLIVDWDHEADSLLVRRVGKREGFYDR